MTRRVLVPLMLATVVLAACTSGSGNLVTQDRPAGAFSRVEVSDALDLRLTVDDAKSPAIRVTFDDNLIDAIATSISGDTLVIEATQNYNVSGGGQVIEVVTPSLTSLTASGSSDVVGSGDVDALSIEVSGASDVDFSSLFAAAVTLDVSGASDVIVNASESATGEASGAADVLVLGNPPVFEIESSGASDVERG